MLIHGKIPEKLLEETIREDMEKAYSKIRMELREEEIEEDELNKEMISPLFSFEGSKTSVSAGRWSK